MKRTVTAFLLALTCVHSSAQTEYLRTVTQQPTFASNVCGSESGGAFVITSGTQDFQPLLLKLDAQGDTLWVKHPFQMLAALGQNLHLHDGHLIAVGQGRVYKLTLDGEVVWNRSIDTDEISTDNGDWVSTVLADGSVAVCRTAINWDNVNPLISNHYRPIVVLLSSDGDLLWTAEHRFETSRRVHSIASDGSGSLWMGGWGLMMRISEATGALIEAFDVPSEYSSTYFDIRLTAVTPLPDGVRFWGVINNGPFDGEQSIATFSVSSEGTMSEWDYFGNAGAGILTANTHVVRRTDGSFILSSGRTLMELTAELGVSAATRMDLTAGGGAVISLGLTNDEEIPLVVGTVGSQASIRAFMASTDADSYSLCEFNWLSLTQVAGGIPELTEETSTVSPLGTISISLPFPFPPPPLMAISEPCISVGVEAVQGTGGYSVHPNPAHSSITVNTGSLSGNGTATITDMSGRTVRSLNLSSSDTPIDISDLRSGMYVLHFSDEKSTGAVRFVKE
jgi:hypothetical protein